MSSLRGLQRGLWALACQLCPPCIQSVLSPAVATEANGCFVKEAGLTLPPLLPLSNTFLCGESPCFSMGPCVEKVRLAVSLEGQGENGH